MLVTQRLGLDPVAVEQATGVSLPKPHNTPAQPPAPRRDKQPALPPDATALWEQMIDRVIRSMKRSGRFADADIRAMVADIRSEQLGVDLTDK